MENLIDLNWVKLLNKRNYTAVSAVLKQIPKDNHEGRMIRGLIQEYFDQNHKSLFEYKKALEYKADLFTRLSFARAHAKISHWQEALKLYKQFTLEEFEFVLETYHHGLIFSYFPYHLQKEIQDHYRWKYGYTPPSNDFGLYLTRNDISLRKICQNQPNKNMEKIFINLIDNDVPNDLNLYLKQNNIPQTLGSQLISSVPDYESSGLIDNSYQKYNVKPFTSLDLLDGWLSPLEGRILFDLAFHVDQEYFIIEIGSWKGKSTCFLSLGSVKGNNAKIISIDPHNWSDQVGIESTFPAWCKNTNYYLKTGILTNIRKKSEDAFQDITEKCGLIFIDGAHDSKAVAADITNYSSKLVKGGFLVFHDSFFPSVFIVLEEKIWYNLDYRIVDVCEGLLIVQYLPSQEKKTRNYTEIVLWITLTYWKNAINEFLVSANQAIHNKINDYYSFLKSNNGDK